MGSQKKDTANSNNLNQNLPLIASITAQAPMPVISTDANGKVIYANYQGKKLLDIWQKNHDNIPNHVINIIKKTNKSGQTITNEIKVNNVAYQLISSWNPNNNQVIIYALNLKSIKKDNESGVKKLSDTKELETKISENIDENTGINNQVALLFIDIDNFPSILNSYGFIAGEALLRMVGKRIENCLRQNDFIALVKNQYIIMLHSASSEISVVVAKKIINTITRPFQYDNDKINLTCSIGIALYPDNEKAKKEQLLSHVNQAVKKAKQVGKNQYAIYASGFSEVQAFNVYPEKAVDSNVSTTRYEEIKKELKKATRDELYMTYQPFFNIITSEIVGYEAFIRWNHPNLGLIYPWEFIPIAEETGTISTIGQWVIEQSIDDYAKILETTKNTKLSLNVSLQQINDPRFIDSISDSFLQYNIKPSQIIIDISEHIRTADISLLKERLNEIKKHNILLSLDHFGSSQISLTDLTSIPLHYLKCSRQFIMNIKTTPKKEKLLCSLLQVASALDVHMLQKGVEKKEEHEALKKIGFNFAQGNLYCPPVELKELKQFIKEYKPKFLLKN